MEERSPILRSIYRWLIVQVRMLYHGTMGGYYTGCTTSCIDILMAKKCLRIGCITAATNKGYCANHQPNIANPVQRQRAEYSRLYDTKGWKTLRKRILFNTPLCSRCATLGTTTAAADVDHVVPHRGDTKLFYDATNLQALCHSCHSYKTARERKNIYDDYR